MAGLNRGTKHVVGFSGGIDSQACAGWVLDTFPKEDVILINSQAGRNEHPITVEHTEWYSRNVHPVIEVVPMVRDLGDVGTKEGFDAKRRRDELDENSEMDFAVLAHVKGRFPSRKAQFCTEYLKLAPAKRWMLENLAAEGYDYIRYSGVRRGESHKRKDTPIRQHDDYFDCDLICPIADWTKEQCFDFVRQRGEKINPLYALGFNRVGCAPCINSSKEDIRNWHLRFPAMLEKVREWEKRVGRTFFPPMVPGLEVNWIDEVVAWSLTERGGRIPLNEVVMGIVHSGCSSKYGLCE